jgi:hypothetical protein
MTKNKNKEYLMKRRRYGWGWTPVKWQSIAVIIMQVVIIFVAATFLPLKPIQPTVGELIAFFMIVSLSITTLIIFSSVSAPKPSWRWGKKPTDNPEEDF